MTAEPTLARPRQRLILVAMTLANAMVLVDQTAVPLTLPEIMTAFSKDSQAVQWVLNASLLSLAGLLVLGGKLGDLLGRRRVFVLGALIFTGASACAGLAPAFSVLIVFRVLQGVGGALMLPTTIAIVSAAFPGREGGSALGTMGGAAAVAGAAGPVIGGGLTAGFGWRSVLLVNVPLAALAVLASLRAVPADAHPESRPRVDVLGSVLLALGLVGFVVGVGQSQDDGWLAPDVLLPLAVSVVALIAFVLVERSAAAPLVDFSLLRRFRLYRSAVVSQGLGGMAEMGLGVIFPLLLILNLKMSPPVAGLALLPATLPMIVVAPLAGRWYDRVGGRWPLSTGYALLAASGLLLAGGGFTRSYLLLLPGLVLFGLGLAVVLTVNDPLSLDSLPDQYHGEASGVSATAEQFGGALGIALFYLVFHTSYVSSLNEHAAREGLDPAQLAALRQTLYAAEQTGLRPELLDPALSPYLTAARAASEFGYGVTFAGVTVLGIIGILLTWAWVARTSGSDEPPAG